MFFGSPNMGQPFSAIQFGTTRDFIYILDYNWDNEVHSYRFQTWISKPTQEAVAEIRRIKNFYKDYQRQESRSARENQTTQYVQLMRPVSKWTEIFEPLSRHCDRSEEMFAELEGESYRTPNTQENDVFYRPPKSGRVMSLTKRMFRYQVEAMKDYSYQAIITSLYVIKNLRGYLPLNWCFTSRKNNRLITPKMINRMATHVK